MATLEKALEDAGYKVLNEGYASTTDTVENLAEASIPPALAACGESGNVNFVTHSMGGILVRYYLSQHTVENLGRVVMLGPPNKGSQVVDELGNLPGFEFINGPAGLQLGTGKSSLPNALGLADFDVGIIAGSRSINLLLSTQLPNPDDGKVSVENTKLEGMNDHIVMPVTHTFMMRNDEVIQQVLHYLQNGAFARH
ncbi:alpha/beta hydrolase [Simiduia sp. 21SJ11W-1]|uniref:esterase/lipase family protein n=1 Tax=Simiduia sp. 21SJ11W-1 TaxID=2909669 RepID=UPI00209DA368|nr:alpha/beta hydrolase [Simiduia sp. 21SJ11W-1]UTA49313.1 alpha/beta hydrolase [Simiduia sp. 21SJ11W-1]